MSVFLLLSSDLSRMEGLEHIVLGTFSSLSEEVRSAASYTLGECACAIFLCSTLLDIVSFLPVLCSISIVYDFSHFYICLSLQGV